jgi:hypothetical protein
METSLSNLESSFSGLMDLSTFQEAYGLAPVSDGSNQYNIQFLRITNESTGFDKPEVLIMGGQHGDEKSGSHAVFYLVETLLNNYGTDDLITYLVDHREIYIVPVVNPYGFVHEIRLNENGEDLNRDYSYDPNLSGVVYSGIGSRGIHELSKRHLFVTMADFHSGTELICHPWGTPGGSENTHIAPNDTSPDHSALDGIGNLMSSRGGSFSGALPVMTCHDLAPVFGPVDDYSYAAGWDTDLSDPAWPTGGSRSMAFTVELSDAKTPDESTLGGTDGLFEPGGTEDGYVPKGIRMALVLIDLAEPYVRWVTPPPASVTAGEEITVSWKVGGALSVDQTDLRYGYHSDPAANPQFETADQSGGTHWDGTVYSQTITIPSTTGQLFFTARARVDQSLAAREGETRGAASPQSIFVNTRTDPNYSIANSDDPEGTTTTGSLDWYSETAGTIVSQTDVPAFPSYWSLFFLALFMAVPLRGIQQTKRSS